MKKYILILLLCSFVGNAQYNLFARQNFSHKIVSGYDSDAQLFITATGLTDNTQKTALNNLVLALKANLLWARLKAIYPVIGGTAFTHKFNLKDPRDLDAAFRLNFFGTSVVHSATGMKPTNGVWSTYLIPSVHLSTSSGNLTYYSRENIAGGYDMGAADDGGISVNVTSLITRYSSDVAAASYGNGSYACQVASTDSRGMFMTNRNDATNTTLWKNGAKLKTTAEAVSLPNYIISINGANGAGSSGYASSKECAFASIGGGFSDAESLIYYNIIQAYQTELGRQVP